MAWVSSVQEQRQYQSALILHEQNQVVLFSFLHHPAGVSLPPWKWSLVSRKPPVPNQLAKWPVTAHLNHFKRKWYWLHLFKSYSSHFLTSFESKTKTKQTNKKNHTVAENSALKFSVVNHRGKQRGARHNWFACLIKCWYFRKHQIVKLI